MGAYVHITLRVYACVRVWIHSYTWPVRAGCVCVYGMCTHIKIVCGVLVYVLLHACVYGHTCAYIQCVWCACVWKRMYACVYRYIAHMNSACGVCSSVTKIATEGSKLVRFAGPYEESKCGKTVFIVCHWFLRLPVTSGDLIVYYAHLRRPPSTSQYFDLIRVHFHLLLRNRLHSTTTPNLNEGSHGTTADSATLCQLELVHYGAYNVVYQQENRQTLLIQADSNLWSEQIDISSSVGFARSTRQQTTMGYCVHQHFIRNDVTILRGRRKVIHFDSL